MFFRTFTKQKPRIFKLQLTVRESLAKPKLFLIFLKIFCKTDTNSKVLCYTVSVGVNVMGFFDIFKKKNKNNTEITNNKAIDDVNEIIELLQKMYQDVFDAIIGYLPNCWKRVAIYTSIFNSLKEVKYFVDLGKGYSDCYDIYNGNKYDLYDLFERINKICLEVRQKLPKKRQWSIFKMYITSDGKMNADFDYSDLEKEFVNARLNWEKSLN